MEIEAELYNATNQPQMRDAIEIARTIIEKRFDTIVDVGCGSGNVTLNVVGKFFEHEKIYALDIDENMVEFASKEYPSEKIVYEVGDIGGKWENLSENLKKLKGSVDLIWSNRVLHWVQDKPTMANNIVRLLRPGGKFLANITEGRDLYPFMDSEMREPEGRKIWRNMMTREEEMRFFENIFKDAGIQNLHVEYKERYGEFEFTEQLHATIQIDFPFYKKQRIVMEEFEKLSEPTQNKIKDFVFRSGLGKLNEPPSETIDPEQKGYHYGQYFITGSK